jgi:TPR repeat protein
MSVRADTPPDQGIMYYQYNLGLKYQCGRGVPRDDAEAAKWYRKAAEQGHRMPSSIWAWCIKMAKVFLRIRKEL